MKFALKTLALLLAVGTAPPVLAATWTVQRDGSGDFSVIQDAIDAADPGDTILIGPGRYDTFHAQTSTVDNFPFAAICWVAKADLTIVGAGRDVTFLGPETPTGEIDGLPTGSLYLDGGAAGTTVEGVQLDNTTGIVTIRDQSVIQDCRVDRVPLNTNFAVVLFAAPDVEIRQTEFLGPNGIITGSGTSGLVVEDCTFHDDTDEGRGVSIGNGAQNCIVRRCTFTRGGGGISFSLGGTGLVEDCVINGMKYTGINLSSGAGVIRRCEVGLTRIALRAAGGTFEVYDTMLWGGTSWTVLAFQNLLMRNCHILNASETTVWGRSRPPYVVDLRYNWWGTSDTAQIEHWILNEAGAVIWTPIADAPVPTDERSIGELKGLFNRQ